MLEGRRKRLAVSSGNPDRGIQRLPDDALLAQATPAARWRPTRTPEDQVFEFLGQPGIGPFGGRGRPVLQVDRTRRRIRLRPWRTTRLRPR